MDFLLDALTNWLKEMLVGGIMGNLSGMFDSVNQQVADISVQVGQTPQGWNGSIFSMIQNLSNSIMVPIAGVILATARLVTPKNSEKNMRKKSCSIRLLKTPLMIWGSRSYPKSRSCKLSMPSCWKKRKKPMLSSGAPVRKCGSF